jgi:type I restriction enzyme S subunit
MKRWPTVPLRDAADIAAGITLGRKTTETDLVSVPYLRVANVQDGRLNLTTVTHVAATRKEIAKWRLEDGDLLLTEGGDLDKLGRGTCWREQLPLCIHQNHIFRLRLHKDRYDPDFVSLQVGSPYGKAYFFAHAKKTTGIASINQQVLGSFPLLSPALKEQRKIAISLKDQLAAAEDARQAALAQLNDSKRLIPALLSATFDHLDDAEWRPIGEVAKTTSGTTPSRGRKDLWEPPLHPWVRTGEVAFKPINQTEESVSAKALAECSLTLLPAGTVLVAMYGQGKTRGQSALLNVSATTNQACFAILPSAALDPEYLQFWLRHSYIALRSLSDARGGNQSNLNGALMNAFEVPLLPLKKQREIARLIRQAIAEADELQRTIEAQLKDIELLPSRLLAEVFGAASQAENDGD